MEYMLSLPDCRPKEFMVTARRRAQAKSSAVVLIAIGVWSSVNNKTYYNITATPSPGERKIGQSIGFIGE